MYCCYVPTRWVYSWVLFIGLKWSYEYSKRIEFNFGRGREILAWGGPVLLDIYLLLLKSFGCDPCLWFFWRSCSLGEFYVCKMFLWREDYPVFHHVALTSRSQLYFKVHIKYSLLSGMGLMRSWVSENICVYILD